jgi:hypothetical protein
LLDIDAGNANRAGGFTEQRCMKPADSVAIPRPLAGNIYKLFRRD